MGTLKGTLKQKLEGQFVLFYDGKEVTHPLSQRVAPFAGSLKEGDAVEFDLKGEEISFIKKEYKPYVKAPPKPAPPKPAEVPVKADPKPEAPAPVEPAVVANTHPTETVNVKEQEMKRVPAAAKPESPVATAPKTSLGEKDYKMTCMSALKGAVSVVEGVLEAAPDFMRIEKETISLGEMCDDVSDEVIKQAEKLLEWMDVKWQEKRFK